MADGADGSRSGFVTILGKPNVGKSTLLNALVGTKVAIVSRRAQTTRDAIQGVLTERRGQIVFVDSPGIHQPSKQLGQRMAREIRRATLGCHLALLMVDASAPLTALDERAIAMAKQMDAPALLLANKVDLVRPKKLLLPFLDRCRQLHSFEGFLPVSALRRINLDRLLDEVFRHLPEAPGYYPDGFVTDQPERFLAAELIRERILRETHDEVPHSVAVQIERWETAGKKLSIGAVVMVERQGQKAILIGGKGEKMKQLGTKARQSLEKRFGTKVRLEVFVKVRKNWRNRQTFVRDLDRQRMLGQ